MSETTIVIRADGTQAERTMGVLGGSVEGVTKKLFGMSGAAGALGSALSITAFAGFLKNTVNSIDALNDLSDASGASIENLSALEQMASRTGTRFDTVGSTLVKFNNVLSEAKPGSPAEQALKAIGLSVEELRKLDPAEALRVTAVALNGFADDGNKARLVQELFGKSVREVAPLLKDLAEQGKLTGSVTKQMADEADQFNKNLAVMETNLKNVGRALTADLITGINKAAQAFRESGLIAAIQTLITGDDEYKNNKRLVELTNDLQRAENALSQSRARDAKFGDKSLATVAAEKRLAAIKAELATVQSMRQMLEGGATGVPSAAKPEEKKKSVGALADPAEQKKINEETRRLREQDIANLVKRAEEVDRLNFEEAKKKADQQIKEKEQAEASELAWRQGLAQRIAAMQEAAASEVDIERGKLTAIQNDLTAARELGWLTEVQYHEMMEQAQLEHEARMGGIMAQGVLARQKLSKQSWDTQVASYAGMFKNMTNTAATSNKTLFEINKAAGIAEAVVNTYRSATGAYAALAPIPIVGPFLGAAAAAVAIGAGLANVNAIRSAQYGAGTSAPSIAGGNAIPVYDAGASTSMQSGVQAPGTGAAASRQQVSITFQGSGRYTREEIVDGLLPALESALADGAGSANVNVAFG